MITIIGRRGSREYYRQLQKRRLFQKKIIKKYHKNVGDGW
jgi:hypothetical protein